MDSAEDRARLAREVLDFAGSLGRLKPVRCAARHVRSPSCRSRASGLRSSALPTCSASGARKALAQAMFSDVLSTLRRVPELDEIAVVTGDRAAESAASGERVTVLHDSAQSGQSDAALIGIRHALATGYERALLVPGDTPLLQPARGGRLISGTRELVIVARPARHRHERARALATGRDRAGVRAGQLRAPRGGGRGGGACRTAPRRWPA